MPEPVGEAPCAGGTAADGHLRFHTSETGSEQICLQEYAGRMQGDQNNIDDVVGQSTAGGSESPHVESVRKRSFEVLYVPVPYLSDLPLQHAGKALKLLGSEDSDVGVAYSDVHSDGAPCQEPLGRVIIDESIQNDICYATGDEAPSEEPLQELPLAWHHAESRIHDSQSEADAISVAMAVLAVASAALAQR